MFFGERVCELDRMSLEQHFDGLELEQHADVFDGVPSHGLGREVSVVEQALAAHLRLSLRNDQLQVCNICCSRVVVVVAAPRVRQLAYAPCATPHQRILHV